MTKTLIIAEKPSVANDIAKALGGFTKYEDYTDKDYITNNLSMIINGLSESTAETSERGLITTDGGKISYDVYTKTEKEVDAHFICNFKKNG